MISNIFNDLRLFFLISKETHDIVPAFSIKGLKALSIRYISIVFPATILFNPECIR